MAKEGLTMDKIHVANGVVSIFCALALTWVVLHPRIQEGLLIKSGLVLMIFSLLATASMTLGPHYEDWHSLWRAGFTLRLGLLMVALGVLWKSWIKPFGGFGRRAGDWLSLRRKMKGMRR
jgi:hypothetical protein